MWKPKPGSSPNPITPKDIQNKIAPKKDEKKPVAVGAGNYGYGSAMKKAIAKKIGAQ
jgi:hypothetical protein